MATWIGKHWLTNGKINPVGLRSAVTGVDFKSGDLTSFYTLLWLIILHGSSYLTYFDPYRPYPCIYGWALPLQYLLFLRVEVEIWNCRSEDTCVPILINWFLKFIQLGFAYCSWLYPLYSLYPSYSKFIHFIHFIPDVPLKQFSDWQPALQPPAICCITTIDQDNDIGLEDVRLLDLEMCHLLIKHSSGESFMCRWCSH